MSLQKVREVKRGEEKGEKKGRFKRSSNYTVEIKSPIFQLRSRNKSEGFPIT
jgi:hypothetical protein